MERSGRKWNVRIELEVDRAVFLLDWEEGNNGWEKFKGQETEEIHMWQTLIFPVEKKQLICAAELGTWMMNVYIVLLGKGAGQGKVKRSLGITDVWG